MNKRISDLTDVATGLRPTSMIEIELASGGGRKSTLTQLFAALGINSYTVAGLPSASPANKFAYATNGRKVGEGVGAGTGVMVRSTGSVWQTVDAGTTVAA